MGFKKILFFEEKLKLKGFNTKVTNQLEKYKIELYKEMNSEMKQIQEELTTISKKNIEKSEKKYLETQTKLDETQNKLDETKIKLESTLKTLDESTSKIKGEIFTLMAIFVATFSMISAQVTAFSGIEKMDFFQKIGYVALVNLFTIIVISTIFYKVEYIVNKNISLDRRHKLSKVIMLTIGFLMLCIALSFGTPFYEVYSKK